MSTPTPQALSLAMAMIDRRGWGVPGQTIDMVRALTIDAPDLPEGHYREIGSRTAAEILYGDPKLRRTAENALKKLAQDRILETVPGSGTRGTAYRINGRFGEWQNVPWRPSQGVALTRLGSFSALTTTAQGRASAAVHAAALAAVVPLSLQRRKEQLVPSYGQRHNVVASAAIWTAAQGIPESARHLLPESSDELSFSDQEKKRFDALRTAVFDLHVGRKTPFLAGDPRRRLEAIARDVDDAGCAVLVDVLTRQGPRDLPVPELVTWLEDQRSAPRPTIDRAKIARDAERTQLLTERSIVVDQLGNAVDVDFALQLQNELADVDTAIARLDRDDLDEENDLAGEA